MDANEEGAREKCGVFGIFAPELDVSRITFFSLVALQHRGQESCGIATYDNHGSVHIHTGMGLVNQVFNEANLSPLQGKMAIGHTRYSTAGKSVLENAQPVVVRTLRGQIGLAQNGNLTAAKSLRKMLLEKGVGMFKESDVEIIVQMIAANPPPSDAGDTWEARISSFMQLAEGAYSLVIMTPEAIFGVRDFLGLRPLSIGKLVVDGEGDKQPITRYVIASETCAISTIGGQYVREVLPGEIVRIDGNGISSFVGRAPSPSPALCSFEYVYFSRPDSLLQGQLIHRVRQRLGEQLAIEAPPPTLPADSPQSQICVIGVPDSSLPAAIGYANKCGIPYSEGLCKNRYIHRTFIQPSDHLRKLGVRLKFNPLADNIRGKRVVLVDDSIVRGNTISALVSLIRGAGAIEVHVRISSPPVRHPCFMGIDMATYEQLTSHNHTIEQVQALIGADSLAYLSHEGMINAIKLPGEEKPTYCSACFTGKYPLKINDW